MSEDRKTWVGRFTLVSPWFAQMITSIKKDCKTEHLRIDPQFVRQYFGGVPLHLITVDQIRSTYLQLILSGNERLAAFVANRWLFRHMDLYRFFESFLQRLFPEFEKVSQIPADVAQNLIQEAVSQFGSEKVFCFVVINDVMIPDDQFEALQKNALDSLALRQNQKIQEEDEDIGSSLRAQMDRIKVRHDKKVADMVKKHQIEVSQLTQEIASLREQLCTNKEQLSR